LLATLSVAIGLALGSLEWIWTPTSRITQRFEQGADALGKRKHFGAFFQRVISQQADGAGLIDGRRIFCDGSLFEANASRKSVVTVGMNRSGRDER